MDLRRRIAAGLALALLAPVGGCSDERSGTPDYLRTQVLAPTPRQDGDAKLAYSHDLTIGLGPDAVERHFAAARDRCLKEAALRCVLMQSSMRAGSGSQARPDARLQLRLPHDAVVPFVTFLTTPLSGERSEDVVLREQTTRAEDLSRPIADTARRLAQLNDYRNRLNDLAQKPDPRIEDLVKIAGEQAQVQTQIEEIEGKRRGLDERLDTELLSVAFRSDETRAGILAPVGEVWERSGRILGDNAGSALRFAIGSLPWLPIVVIGLLIVRAAWRLRRRSRAQTGPVTR